MPISTLLLLAAALTGQSRIEPAHARNDVYVRGARAGSGGGRSRRSLCPRPAWSTVRMPTRQRAALRELAGSDQALENMLQPSVTAPHIIKVRDVKTTAGMIRVVDLWFVVHADLKQVDPAQEAARTDQKEVEVGNMWFQTRLLKANDLQAAGIARAAVDRPEDLVCPRAFTLARPDRFRGDQPGRGIADQTESVVLASRTDPAFDKAGPNRNGWKALARTGAAKEEGTVRPYQGGISYAKMSRVAFKPGALFVEMHVAFVEPHEWFQDAPILRSKFSVAAQEQIRGLRRELANARRQK